MADSRRRHAGNVPGSWFVDTTCINCDVSRQCAPWMFGEEDDQAVVIRQPVAPDEVRDATRALLACPTGSIGVMGEKPTTSGLFPEPIAGGVSYCGYTHRDSFGAHAYFVERPEGNLLVDSPRFVTTLVRHFEAHGGLALVLLSHRDDVADAERFAERFGARAVIHEDDCRAAPFATEIVAGREPTALRPGLVCWPLPGHTKGSVAYLLEDRFLFTGDSLYWSRKRGRLSAFRNATWYSWSEQAESLERLTAATFEWVLPGHGDRGQGPPDRMRQELRELVAWMRREG
jgi:glyoxylase-like metal-dependent hydrolase (beta-lactamase superfamily II)